MISPPLSVTFSFSSMVPLGSLYSLNQNKKYQRGEVTRLVRPQQRMQIQSIQNLVDCLPAPFLYPCQTKNISARQITGFASLASLANTSKSRFSLKLGLHTTLGFAYLDMVWGVRQGILGKKLIISE